MNVKMVIGTGRAERLWLGGWQSCHGPPRLPTRRGKNKDKFQGSSRKAGFLQSVPSEKTLRRSQHSNQALTDMGKGEREGEGHSVSKGTIAGLGRECTANTIKFTLVPVGWHRKGVSEWWRDKWRRSLTSRDQARYSGHEGPWLQAGELLWMRGRQVCGKAAKTGQTLTAGTGLLSPWQSCDCAPWRWTKRYLMPDDFSHDHSEIMTVMVPRFNHTQLPVTWTFS